MDGYNNQLGGYNNPLGGYNKPLGGGIITPLPRAKQQQKLGFCVFWKVMDGCNNQLGGVIITLRVGVVITHSGGL